MTLLFIAVALISCKKEKFGPLKLKDGQQVELLVDHRYGSDQEQLLKLPENIPAQTSLSGFNEREPGYTYRVKATFHNEKNPPQDGPSNYFTFEEVISKEQYKGNESFDVQLITAYVPGGPVIRLGKTGSEYYFIPDKLQLTYANDNVHNQLEEIWQNAQEIRANWPSTQSPKWKAIKVTVVHDQQKFGKAYLVNQIQFVQ